MAGRPDRPGPGRPGNRVQVRLGSLSRKGPGAVDSLARPGPSRAAAARESAASPRVGGRRVRRPRIIITVTWESEKFQAPGPRRPGKPCSAAVKTAAKNQAWSSNRSGALRAVGFRRPSAAGRSEYGPRSGTCSDGPASAWGAVTGPADRAPGPRGRRRLGERGARGGPAQAAARVPPPRAAARRTSRVRFVRVVRVIRVIRTVFREAAFRCCGSTCCGSM